MARTSMPSGVCHASGRRPCSLTMRWLSPFLRYATRCPRRSLSPTDYIVCVLQSRSQIQSWDAGSDSSLQRHRDWRSNRDGAGSPETLRHPHKHDERISAWMRASTPVNNELAMIQENRVSKPVPLSLRALTSLLPSSRNPKSGRAAAGQGWRRVHQPG